MLSRCTWSTNSLLMFGSMPSWTIVSQIAERRPVYSFSKEYGASILRVMQVNLNNPRCHMHVCNSLIHKVIINKRFKRGCKSTENNLKMDFRMCATAKFDKKILVSVKSKSA